MQGGKHGPVSAKQANGKILGTRTTDTFSTVRRFVNRDEPVRIAQAR